MNKAIAVALALLQSVPSQAVAEDGQWSCANDEVGATQVTVVGGKVLQTMPDGTKRIPDKVIDLGQEIVWLYEMQEFQLNITSAQLIETVRSLGSRLTYKCRRLQP